MQFTLSAACTEGVVRVPVPGVVVPRCALLAAVSSDTEDTEDVVDVFVPAASETGLRQFLELACALFEDDSTAFSTQSAHEEALRFVDCVVLLGCGLEHDDRLVQVMVVADYLGCAEVVEFVSKRLHALICSSREEDLMRLGNPQGILTTEENVQVLAEIPLLCALANPQ